MNVLAMETIRLSDVLEMDETKPKVSLPKQHPVLPLLPLSSGPPSATQTLIVNYPAARLSSSPASSPNVIEPSIERKASVRPTLGNSMEGGVSPGADFFDDQSSGSEWEDADDEDRTQTFSEIEGVGLGLGSLAHTQHRQYRRSRGRTQERSGLTALPPFNQIPTHSSLDDIENRLNNEGPNSARQVSLTRMEEDNMKVVHNHDSNSSTSRGSFMSNASEKTASHFPELAKPYPIDAGSGAAFLQEDIQGRHRRNTSDSVIADSLINAHLTTMRALKALSPPSSSSIPEVSGHSFYSATSTDLPKTRSFSDARHVKLLPISVADRDHLPSHFVKTPYPFTAKKEFPKPKTRPRHHNRDARLDSGYGGGGSMNEYNDRKGKHVIGLMPSDGEYDLRSRLDRNANARGVLRTRDTDTLYKESVVYLNLQKHRHNAHWQQAKIVIPSDLSTTSPDRQQTIDFDDKLFAERLRRAHRELAGSWVKRQFSARKLRYIQLAQSSAWSGSSSIAAHNTETSRLLALGAGTDTSADAQTPFTEEKLLQLYKHPKTGKARYTWVHWARRVASSNISQPQPDRSSSTYQQASMSGDRDGEDGSVIHHQPVPSPDTITTVQFVHTLSTLRILTALTLVLLTSALAALFWIFMDENGGLFVDVDKQRVNRVGSGMAIGVLVILLELLCFGAWIWRS